MKLLPKQPTVKMNNGKEVTVPFPRLEDDMEDASFAKT